jgi:glycosyltransferase involved in cell wall biosynthesis
VVDLSTFDGERGGSKLRILVVSQDFPWPPTYGSRLRLVQVLEVAASLGDTDLFSLVQIPGPDDAHAVPDDLPLKRWATGQRPLPDYSAARRARFVASRGLPIEVIVAESKPMREQFEQWADSRYDVVWFSKGPTYHLLGRPRLGPTIVDLDDLEDQKITARLVAMRKDGHRGHLDGSLLYVGALAQARLNARKWRSFQQAIAREVECVVLCSELDVKRFGSNNALVVPNGFEVPERPAGRVEVSQPPTILLQGSMRYAPNADAARWLVGTIAPNIRKQIPDVQIRLVGDPDGTVIRLNNPPSVTVTGSVPSMQPELERADLIAVPLRYGSGTRVKILEGFAHRIPVVSTTIGAEGLNLESGRHLLTADEPEAFAQACVRLLQDVELRKKLVDAAYREFEEHHHWGFARDRIKDALLETARTGEQ